MRVEARIGGVPDNLAGQFGGELIAQFNVAPDGTLSEIDARPTRASGKLSGRSPPSPEARAASPRRADAQRRSHRRRRHAVADRRVTELRDQPGTSAQSTTTGTTSVSTTGEKTSDDSAWWERVVREFPKGEIAVGAAGSDKRTNTTGWSGSQADTFGGHRDASQQQGASTTTTGAGLAGTNILRQAIALRISSPRRAQAAGTHELTDFAVGSAAIRSATSQASSTSSPRARSRPAWNCSRRSCANRTLRLRVQAGLSRHQSATCLRPHRRRQAVPDERQGGDSGQRIRSTDPVRQRSDTLDRRRQRRHGTRRSRLAQGQSESHPVAGGP